MFPSSGYFRSLVCPFYASGLCERPYCHFRHTRTESDRAAKTDNGPSYSTSATSIYDNSNAYKGSPSSSSTPGVTSTSASLQGGSYGILEPQRDVGESQSFSDPNTRTVSDKDNEAGSCWSIPSFSSPAPLLPASDTDISEYIEALPKISGLPKSRKNLPSYVPTPKPPFTTSTISSISSVPSYNPTPKSGTDEGKKQSSHFIAYDPVKNFAFCDKTRDSEAEEAKFSDDEDDEAVKNIHSSGLDESSENDKLENKAVNISSDSVSVSNNGDDDLTDSDEDVSWKGDAEEDSSGAKKKSQNLADLLKPSSYFTDKHTTSEASTKSKPDSNAKDLPSSSSSKNVSSRKSISKHSSKRFRSISGDDKSQTHIDSSTSKSSSKSTSKSCDRDIKHSSDKPSSSLSSSSSSLSKTSVSSLSLSSSTNKTDKRVHVSGSSSASGNKSHKSLSDKKHSSSSSLKTSSSTSSHKTSSNSKSHKTSSSSHKSLSTKSLSTKHKSWSSSSSSAKHSGNHRKESHAHSSMDVKPKSSLSNSTSSKHSHTSHSSSSEKENKHLDKSHSSHNASHKSHSISRSLSSSSSSSSKHQDHSKNHLKDKTLDIKDRKVDVKDKKFSSESQKHEKPSKDISKRSKEINNHKQKYSESSVSKVNGIIDGLCNGAELKKERRNSATLQVPLSKDKERKGKLENSSNKEITNKISPNGSYDSDSDIEIVEPPPPPVYSISDSEEENVASSLKAGESDDDFPMPDDLDSESDGDTFDECLKIFQESERQLSEKLKKGEAKHDSNKGKVHEVSEAFESSENILASLGRKRMAHANSAKISRPSKTLPLARPRLSPAEVMHNRIVEMQKRALLRAAKREGRESDLPSQLTGSSTTTTTSSSSSSSTHRSGTLSAAVLSSASTSASSTSRNKSTPSTTTTINSSANGSRQSTNLSPSMFPPSGQKQRTAHAPKAVLFQGQKTPPRRNSSAGGDVAAGPAAKAALYSPNSFYTKKGASSTLSAKTATIAGTASKTEKRKAHEPTLSNLKRPLIPAEFGGKVPTNFRQRYLNLLIDEHLKFRPEEEAYTKAVENEKEIYEKAANKKLYLGVAVNIIKRIRTEAAQVLPSTSKKPCLESVGSSGGHMAQSHAATLGGRNAVRHSYTLNRSKSISGSAPSKIEGRDFYERLKPYIMTEEQLRENGYPRSTEDGSSKVQFYKEESSEDMLRANERVCRRCGKRFTVNKEGDPITKEICVYHYGGIFRKKIARNIEKVYSCCSEREGVKGCQVASLHVHDRNKLDNRTGYMKAIPDESLSSDKNHQVLALDCEMVYTKAGLELARVTVVGEDHKVVYESLVRPETDIVDYNTKFSGITAADMRGVTTNIRGVQAVLLSMISDKTILMGHSLESDLVALKLIHSTVVDTSIVFPHRLGKPYKRALRNLMMDHLQKIIQADDGGHDSKEDAVACMQLMQYKVKEDAKKEYRRF